MSTSHFSYTRVSCGLLVHPARLSTVIDAFHGASGHPHSMPRNEQIEFDSISEQTVFYGRSHMHYAVLASHTHVGPVTLLCHDANVGSGRAFSHV